MGHPKLVPESPVEMKLAAEKVFDLLDEGVAANVADGFGQGEPLGACLDAVLREAALLDAAVSGQGAQAFFFEDGARGVDVEELGLSDGGGSDEVGHVVELRADLHAAAAGDAVGEGVALLLDLRELLGAGAEVVGAVDGNPGLYLLEIFEEHGAVNLQVADDWELRQGGEGDGFARGFLLKLVDESGAGHAGLAVDEHGAGAADLFEAVGVVGDGCGRLTGDVDRVERDFAEYRGDVHARAVGDLEGLGGDGGVRVGLTLDLDFDGAWHCWLPSGNRSGFQPFDSIFGDTWDFAPC